MTPTCGGAGEFIRVDRAQWQQRQNQPAAVRYRFSEAKPAPFTLSNTTCGNNPRWSILSASPWCCEEFPDAFGLTVDEVVAMGRTPHKRAV